MKLLIIAGFLGSGKKTLLEDLVSIEAVGRKDQVKHIDGRNVFEPN